MTTDSEKTDTRQAIPLNKAMLADVKWLLKAGDKRDHTGWFDLIHIDGPDMVCSDGKRLHRAKLLPDHNMAPGSYTLEGSVLMPSNRSFPPNWRNVLREPEGDLLTNEASLPLAAAYLLYDLAHRGIVVDPTFILDAFSVREKALGVWTCGTIDPVKAITLRLDDRYEATIMPITGRRE